MKSTCVFLVLFGLLLGAYGEPLTKQVFCYWSTWSHYRPGDGQFRVENINGSVCSTLIYAYFGVNPDGSIRIVDQWLDIDLKNIEKTVALKETWPDLKVVAGIGGFDAESTTFSTIARNDTMRYTFAAYALEFVEKWGFDGVDITWNYPGFGAGSHPSDKQNFVSLMAAMAQRMKPYGYSVTMAAAALGSIADISYDLPGLAEHVDYLFVRSYDYWGSWESTTGYNAGLISRFAGDLLNTNASIQYYLSKGFPAEKLVVGVPLYGRTFTVTPGFYEMGANASGPGLPGPFTRTAGWIDHNEFCRLEGYETVFDPQSQVPYSYKDDQWISHEDFMSVATKAHMGYLFGLGGVMVWALEADNFSGSCGQGKFPLTNAVWLWPTFP